MVCLDTNFFIEMFRRNQSVRKKLTDLQISGDSVCTTAVTIAELFVGAYSSNKKVKGLAEISSIVSSMSILELDVKAAEKYGELAADPAIKAQPVGAFDLLIASIAIANNEGVMTKDSDFDGIPNLQIVKWQ